MNRYDLIPKWNWPWLGPAYKGLDADLSALEGKVANLDVPSDPTQLGPDSSASAVKPYLLTVSSAPHGIIRTINRITFNSSTSFPIPATWTDPTLLSIRIVNPTDSPSSLNIGLGTYGSANHTTEPDVVAPGQEWVAGAVAVPVFVRASTAGAYVTPVIITERSA